MAKEFSKITVMVQKGQSEGGPVYTGGAKVRFVGLPVNPDGSIALNGSNLTFKGMFGNGSQFVVLDYNGAPFQISTRGQSVAKIPSSLDAAPCLLPIRDGAIFEGIQAIIPVSNRPESEDRAIDIYFEASNL
jgi:hypothetical protein